MRAEGTTKGPRLPTYLPTYPVPTCLQPSRFSGWRNSQRWLLLAAAAAAAAVGRQAAASNTGYLLHLYLLHLLLVLSICLLPRATRRDLCPLPPFRRSSPLSFPLSERARVNLLYIIVVEITTTIQGCLPYCYHHGTVHTVYSGYYSGIASRPLQLHCGQRRSVRARAYVYAHIHVCMHIDDFIHSHTRNPDSRTRIYTYVLIRRYARTERCIRAYACVHKSTTA